MQQRLEGNIIIDFGQGVRLSWRWKGRRSKCWKNWACGDEEKGGTRGTTSLKIATLFSLTNMAGHSISALIVVEAPKSTKAVDDMAREHSTMGSLVAMGSTRMRFSCNSP